MLAPTCRRPSASRPPRRACSACCHSTRAASSIWEEFEANITPEARFANALDRLAGLLSNAYNRGGTWRRFGVSRDAVLRRMEPIREGAPELWPFVLRVVEEAVADGGIVG